MITIWRHVTKWREVMLPHQPATEARASINNGHIPQRFYITRCGKNSVQYTCRPTHILIRDRDRDRVPTLLKKLAHIIPILLIKHRR